MNVLERRFILTIFCYSGCIATVALSSKHWIVTENRRIHELDESLFDMKDPHDLPLFLKQTHLIDRFEMVREAVTDSQALINKHDSQDDPLIEDKIRSSDSNCLLAGKPLTEQNLHVSTVFPIDLDDASWRHLLDLSLTPRSHADNDCQNLSLPSKQASTALNCDLAPEISVNFGSTLDYLKSLAQTKQLSMSPETRLLADLRVEAWADTSSLAASLCQIFQRLEKLDSSWYLLLSYYWRAIGNATEAFDCALAALRIADKNSAAAPLLSLANILHHAGHSLKAAHILQGVADSANSCQIFFSLGQIYATITQYNASIEAFEKCLKLDPSYPRALQQKHAIICHQKIQTALEMQHENLQGVITQLTMYQESMQEMHDLQRQIVSSALDPKNRRANDLIYEEFISGPLPGVNCTVKFVRKRKFRHIDCDIVDHVIYYTHVMQLGSAKNRKKNVIRLQRGRRNLSRQTFPLPIDNEKFA